MCFALQLCIYSNLLSAVGKFSLDLKESRPVFDRGAARGADAREGRRLGRPAGQKRRPVRKERRGVVRVGEEVEGEAFQKG